MKYSKERIIDYINLLKVIKIGLVLPIVLFLIGNSYLLVQNLSSGQATRSGADFIAGLKRGKVPEASTRTVLTPRQFSGCPNGCKSLGDSAKSLNEALRRTGYSQQGWYVIDGNPFATVAVITELEQILSTGRPRTDGKRWDLKYSSSQIDSLTTFVLTVLKGSSPGRYRSFVFGFRPTEHPLTNIGPGWEATYKREQSAAQTSLRNALRAGNRVPVLSSLRSINNTYYDCYVFVYEYVVSPVNGSVTFVESSSLSAEQHLQGAGIWQTLVASR